MRVLLWTQYFWPETFRINELAGSLAKSGLSVTVLTGKPNYPGGAIFPGYRWAGMQREKFSGAELVRIPLLPRGLGSSLRLMLNYLSFIISGYVFAPFAFRGVKFDVVLVYAPSPLLQALPAILLARLKRAPLIVWVQDLWPESLVATGNVRNPLVLWSVEVAVRHIYRRADSILIQSEAFRAPVARLADDEGKIRFFPNSADVPDLTPAEGEKAHLLANEMRERFSVVFTGNIGQAQAMETIVEAAEQLRNHPGIRLYVVGDGSRSEWIAEEVRQRKLENLRLTGRFPAGDIPVLLNAAAVLLVTLRNDAVGTYTIPSKLQGYLAAKRPIIACINGEGARVVEEAQAGLVCPAEDSKALADAVLRLHAMSADERMSLGQNGYRYFMNHFEAKHLNRELIAHLEWCHRQRRGAKE